MSYLAKCGGQAHLADEVPYWSDVLDMLPTAVMLLSADGGIFRENEASSQLASQMPFWPPVPLDGFSASHQKNIWLGGHRLQCTLRRQGQWCWMSVQPDIVPQLIMGLNLVLDMEGVVLYQSPGLTRMSVSLLGQSILEEVEPDEREDLEAALKEPNGGELMFVLHDSHGRAITLSAHLSDKSDDDNIGAFLLACWKGDQLRQLYDQIRGLERRFLRLLEGLPAAVIVEDPNAGTQYINTRARNLLEKIGVPLSEANGWLRQGTGAVLLDSKTPYPPHMMPSERARNGEVSTIDNLEIVRNQRQTVLELTAAPVKAKDGRILSIITMMRPITARYRFERQQHRAKRLDATGQLAGELAHDFSNFLQVIASCASIAQDSLYQGHPAQIEVDSIVQVAMQAEDLTRQLRTVSRRQKLSLRSVSLNTSVRSRLLMLKNLSGEQITIQLSLDKALWEVKADSAVLERILINLVINARDAMPGGGQIWISTERLLHTHESAAFIPEATPGAYGVLVIRDIGTGIPPEVLSRVFEPYYTTKAPGKGTGLGLSMVYGSVLQMGGYIQVHSSLGAGTEFRVALQQYKQSSLSFLDATLTHSGA